MQTILMIGDSVGVPNYYGPPGVDAKYHIEFLLRDYGYVVYNCSLNACSNLTTLQRAKDLLAGQSIPHPSGNYKKLDTKLPDLLLQNNIKVDWVVWFHTELFRDSHLLGNDYTIEQGLKLLANETYPAFFEFAKSLTAKTAIIGGEAPVEPELYDYGQPDFIIADWKSEILQIDLPKIRPATNWVQNSKDDISYKMNLLRLHEQYLNQLRASEHFPDDAHPGIEPHKLLADTLDKVFRVR